MTSRSLSRRTLLKGTGAVTIGLPLLEEMLRPAPVSAKDSRPEIPVRAFNVFFGLGIPAPLQTEGFAGVLEPLKPLSGKLLIMRNVDQDTSSVACASISAYRPTVFQFYENFQGLVNNLI